MPPLGAAAALPSARMQLRLLACLRCFGAIYLFIAKRWHNQKNAFFPAFSLVMFMLQAVFSITCFVTSLENRLAGVNA